MRFKLLIISLLFLSVGTTYSSQYPKHQLGISFSTISGTGLGYVLEFDRYNALQFTLMTYYTGSSTGGNLNLTVISGIEYQRTIHRDAENKLYAFGAASLWYFEKNSTKVINSNTDFEKEIDIYDKDVFHNLGIGIGYDYILNKVVSFNVNLGLQYQTTANDSFANFLERTRGSSSFLGLGGGVGILFHL
jgi:hypothetical protein